MSSGDGSRRSSRRPDNIRCHARGAAPRALALIIAILPPALSLPPRFARACTEGSEGGAGKVGKAKHAHPRLVGLAAPELVEGAPLPCRERDSCHWFAAPHGSCRYFAGDRPSIFAISSSRLSTGGSAFAFPGRTLRSGAGEETCSGNLALALALTASRRGFRSGGGSVRPGERDAAGDGAGDSVGFGGRRNAASSRCAISARLFSSDCPARGAAPAARFASAAAPSLPSPASGGG